MFNYFTAWRGLTVSQNILGISTVCIYEIGILNWKLLANIDIMHNGMNNIKIDLSKEHK
jgi:hypothetical protein